ncbi:MULTISPECIES: bifunctional diguanylate cyclase/phosphodiesterase [Thiorhodovibrio]|uniref:bifunctional diguanylate cyclase/phosphodiesterase n=1 Tax=Thiorhodovibrio TaxID=61593 RepID=UPI001912AC4C|nr:MULTISPECIES: EAL domain-containing protein [Thiorhodovibrio]WPL12633.1 Cyclic di-GMP phosphodiesterase Gmr [Thiorhodovibrio litoralis]
MSPPRSIPSSPRKFFLGLRWKVVLGISLTLIPLVAFLTLYARASLLDQFQQTQSRLRSHQSNHFRTLVRERYQQMSRLANMVPALASLEDQGAAPADRMTDPGERLHLALESIGSLLDLEWDIRSVHWLALGEAPVALWPTDSEPLPDALIAAVNKTPEQLTEQLQCDASHCRQYISSPILWHGETAGTLVLGRALGSILLTFQQLTGANLAIATPITTLDPDSSAQATTLRFQGATEPDIILPLLESQPTEALLASSSETPLAVHFGTHWYEIFHIDTSDAGLTAFVINRTTDERLGIRAIARNSLLIGLIGLLLAEVLLLLILRGPVERIRALSNLLPLLAENRFDALAERLPRTGGRLRWRDEIDTNVEVIGTLNQRMAIMQTEREAAQRELHWLADHDPLTSLLNRRRFDHELTRAIERASATGTQGALLFVDLDNFKDVNDTSGHQVGDRLIRRIAKRLSACIRQRGRIGRFGGDEFAMLLHPVVEPELDNLIKEFQQQIRSTSVRAGNHRHQVSASIGVVLFPEHGADTQALMANADLAMYQAKANQHRGHWHLYSEADMARAQANERVLWTHEIGNALDFSRFQLFYQPIMALPERRIWRAEALLRLPLPDGRIANPAEFIPVAERTGLINAIDRWVIANAVRVLSEHPRLSLAVNLSAKSLADPTLDGELMQVLHSSGIDPQRLTLEITETVAIDNMEVAIARMNSLRALGCRFALDDFGSGFASYAYLKQLPVDDVKIDGSFIRNLDHNAEDRIFVTAATEMAHAMGKKVIAEFVESEAILDVLIELGIDFGQGYFIGRPVPELPAPEDARPEPQPLAH